MFQDLNEEIVRIKGELHRKKKLQLQLEDYQQELTEIEHAITRLKNQLKDEKKDVKKLEGFTITNFFSTITGTKYEKLDKEHQEVLAVKLQLEEAEKSTNEIRQAIIEIQENLSEITYSEIDYKQLLDRKAQIIKNSNLRVAEELYSLSDQEGDIQAYVKEIKEAIEAGNFAMEALNRAEESLESAASWGTWDMLGGGFLTTAMKHSNMDEASEHIHDAQVRMRNFQKELLDIHEMIQVDMDVSGLLKFADFFFDNVIVDWMVQRQINDSLDQVINQFNNVGKIVDRLNNELVNLEGKLLEVKLERRTLIESL